MPRPRRKTSARNSRNSGEISGVTIYSLPSGATIDKTGISAGTMTATGLITTATGLQVTSGASIALYKVQNNKGFMVGNPNYGTLYMETGVTTVPATQKTMTFANITSLKHISGHLIEQNANVTPQYVVFTYEGNTFTEATGVSRVRPNIYVSSPAAGDVGIGISASMAYIAIGT